MKSSVFPNIRDATFDWSRLDGKTLKVGVAWDGDYGLVVGQDTTTGYFYVLAEIKRPK